MSFSEKIDLNKNEKNSTFLLYGSTIVFAKSIFWPNLILIESLIIENDSNDSKKNEAFLIKKLK